MTENISLKFSIFISYAHEDREYLNELNKPLSLVRERFGCQLWEDSHIEHGENWEAEIYEHLAQADLAILLLSPNFVASDFILHIELPLLLKRFHANEVKLLPVMVGKVDLELIGINKLQTIPPPEQPLNSIESKVKCDDYYYEIAKSVKKILQASAYTDETSTQLYGASKPLAYSPQKTTSWSSLIPNDEISKDDIEHQLNDLIKKTSRKGMLNFTRGKHYVQFAFFRELNANSIVIEVISNAYLPPDYPLSKLQISRLSELKFTQRSDEENWQMVAPINGEDALGKLAKITLHILNEILNCRLDANLEVYAQCW